ncbi:hypothetical protein KA183_00685 [bacterium]|nr:hypothetical protein [bacterium]QQR57181.1 MAG: hypothetical protein IPG59_19685 [Candidatus Melainabacteria bacterium]
MNKHITQFCRLSTASWLLSLCFASQAFAQQNNMEQMLDQMSNSNWNNVPVSGTTPRIQTQTQMGTPPCYVPPGVSQRMPFAQQQMGQQFNPMQGQVNMPAGNSPMPMPMSNSPMGKLLPLLRAMNQQNSLPDQAKNTPGYKQKVQGALGAVKYELSNATSQASKAEFYCSKAGYGKDKGARQSNANEARYAANNARGCADRAYSRGGSIPECQSIVSQARSQANRAEAAANRAAAAVNW